jgi:hypothetical protein
LKPNVFLFLILKNLIPYVTKKKKVSMPSFPNFMDNFNVQWFWPPIKGCHVEPFASYLETQLGVFKA